MWRTASLSARTLVVRSGKLLIVPESLAFDVLSVFVTLLYMG